MRMPVKDFSTAWLVEEVRLAKELKSTKNAELALHFLINDLENYISHISKNAHRKGCGTSEKKAAASIANGAKGGRPKGSKKKPKYETTPNPNSHFTKLFKNGQFDVNKSIEEYKETNAKRLSNDK